MNARERKRKGGVEEEGIGRGLEDRKVETVGGRLMLGRAVMKIGEVKLNAREGEVLEEGGEVK